MTMTRDCRRKQTPDWFLHEMPNRRIYRSSSNDATWRRPSPSRPRFPASNKDCLSLIAAYRKHPFLWNPRHQFYLHRDKKQEAWVAIGRLFGYPAEVVRKKMQSLLRIYRREKTKAKRSSDTQNGDFEPYTSTWYAYNRMNFLDDEFDMRNLHNESDEECDSFKPDDQGPFKSEPDRLSEVLGCVEAVYDVQAVSEKFHANMVFFRQGITNACNA